MKWFRMYSEVLNDQKVQTLDGETFKFWVNCLCVASQREGALPELSELSFLLRIDTEATQKLTQSLLKARLLDEVKNRYGTTYYVHGWEKRQYKSDTSTERVKRFRNGKVTASETPPDTDTEQNRTETDETSKNFEVFWTNFPRQRRGNIDKAEAAYRKALTRATAEEIRNGLSAYVTSDEVKNGFAKGAAAWLNDDRWANLYARPEAKKNRMPSPAGG